MSAKSPQARTWHHKHEASYTPGQRVADAVAATMGSWGFIIGQTIFVVLWMVLNVIAWAYHWDAYPFILLNLLFSTQAAYAAPIIMMSQNRQSERDRVQAQEDFDCNLAAKKEIEALQQQLSKIETDKLDIIIQMLQKTRDEKQSNPAS